MEEWEIIYKKKRIFLQKNYKKPSNRYFDCWGAKFGNFICKKLPTTIKVVIGGSMQKNHQIRKIYQIWCGPAHASMAQHGRAKPCRQPKLSKSRAQPEPKTWAVLHTCPTRTEPSVSNPAHLPPLLVNPSSKCLSWFVNDVPTPILDIKACHTNFWYQSMSD